MQSKHVGRLLPIKYMPIGVRYLLITVLAFSLLACSGPVQESQTSLNLFVSILPQKYFVERIGGEHVTVSVMVDPGADPHTYEPKPEQLRALSTADAYFRIRVTFEDAWMDRIAGANSSMLIVDTTQDIERMPMEEHHDGEGDQHAGGELDPHIWLSPSLVKIQAQTIYDALIQLDPQHQADYDSNLNNLLTDIDALDSEIRQALAGVTHRGFMVFHPSWGYFARDYDLEMISIEIGGQEPSAAELGQLVSLAKEDDIKVVFAQPELSTRSAEIIAAEIGGQVLLIDPLAADWLENLRTVAHTFAQVLNE